MFTQPAEIMDMPLRPLLASLLLAASLTAQAATEVIPLQHRSSAELLPAAQSFLGKDGSVSTFEDKLIVNASQERIDDLRTLLQQLDTAPKRLLISVDNNDSNFQDNRGNARVIHYGTANRDGGLQQIQASEGQPALIQVGQSIPITSTSTDGYGRIQSDTQYRNVTQGFYVTPRLTGDTVRLQISTNNDRMSQERADVVKVQSTDTTVTGRLGEWITLAGYNQDSQAERSASSLSYSTQRGENMTLRVKVDLLD
ncbi:secretin N-terminal domain-containing protein [Pseudomonas sp. zfem004]|uniref:secretin N-terminal domain-containing protein n=1 Tax=Pseudomonas sp. zfem004 TaxID=3078199 RepID=UPI0029291A49|nr:secretin N-terminal domain-containing protein [Pseudomonas sp. zfem004]MDU9401984.1 secretin N-terminal domain-containing protein [Pseudomonas sp. zfem004]